MKVSRCLMMAGLVGLVVFAGPACTEKARDEATKTADTALEATKEGADKALDATREGAHTVIEKTKAVAATTGQVVTDGWMTTTLKAKFVNETLLKGSDINVDTTDHVITLKGTVASDAAKTRAVALARGTEGVTHVVNQLVVRER